MPVFNNILAGAAGQAGGAAAVEGPIKSLRFNGNGNDDPYLERSVSSASNRRTFTFAAWVKNDFKPGNDGRIFSAGTSPSNIFDITLSSVNEGSHLRIYNKTTTVHTNWNTANKLRDTSAWFHVVCAIDTTQATQANRVKVYINGVHITENGTTNTLPGQNDQMAVNDAVNHYLGRSGYYGGDRLAGYLADVYFIDGQQLDPTSFGAFDDNGVWQASGYSGTYGTNGFHLLDFANESTVGHDSSGNENDFTANNISTFDGTIAAASGALPILNTTGSYGGTVGSGTRTDSNSSSIVLALPMNGTNGGTTFTDQHATIKGSGSAKTITANADAQTSTAQSYFYGSSAKFDGTGDYLASTETDIGNFGTGDFTVEYWANNNSTQPSPNFSPQVGTLADSTPDNTWRVGTFQSNGKFTLATHDGAGFNDVTFNSTNYNDDKWHHFCMQRSSGTVTAYVDGVSIGTASVTTNFSATKPLQIGREGFSPTHYTGYIQDLRIYKGAAKYSSNFNPPSRTGGSGCDSLFDVPTNGTASDTGAGGEVSGNYCCWNALNKGDDITLSNGNLDASSGSGLDSVAGTIGMSSGKWYWEHTVVTFANMTVGIASSGFNPETWTGADANTWSMHSNGNKYHNGSNSAYGSTYGLGDVIGVAFDADGGNLYFYINGTVQNSGTAAYTGLTSGPYFPAFSSTDATAKVASNWGQRVFAYSAPSNYKALCTTNLPTPTIADGSDYFDVSLWTGNGSTQSITGLSFSPDFVWIKNRGNTADHRVYDTVRGALEELLPNQTNAETTRANSLTAFNSDGYSLGSYGGVNNNGTAAVGWAWDAGTSTVSNTDGSITSSVRANQSAGFSIVTYSATGSNLTVGHGLNAQPAMIWLKTRNSTGDWLVMHESIGVDHFLKLNLTQAKAGPYSNVFTSVSSSTFGTGNDSGINSSGQNKVAYCFAPVAGYSAFGSYEGNGSSDGPFVYLGFKPALVILKLIEGVASSWKIYDDKRDPDNPIEKQLYPNSSNAEPSDDARCDFLSNGFKIRTAGSEDNYNNNTFIYAAFASNPFQANGGLAR